MKGKYQRSKKKNTVSKWTIILPILLVLLIAVGIWLSGLQYQEPGETSADADNPMVQGTAPGSGPITLGQGLYVTQLFGYTGPYVEDGTDEALTDVMALVLENTSEQDLQLARVYITYEDVVGEFEVTNLPAGSSVLVLEKSRQTAVDDFYQFIETKNVVFFEQPMDLLEEKLEVSTANGKITVTNISGADIENDIYIYYKNVSGNTFYGGITYRVAVEDGLLDGESAVILSRHYSEETSRILHITCGE